MARLNRLVITGEVHLMTQVAQAGLAPFERVVDCEAFLQALRRAALEKGATVQGYALLPDRYLVLATPTDQEALSRMAHALSRWFGAAFNRAHDRAGSLWRGRHTAAPIGRSQIIEVLIYIEHAAVRTGLVANPLDHRWSSACHHALGTRDAVMGGGTALWSLGNTPFEREAMYKVRLLEGLGKAALDLIERTAAKGWPLASAEELGAWQEASGRRMSPRPRGRKPKRTTF